MKDLLGRFKYSGIEVAWTLEDGKHEVSDHRQFDYEELCFEHTKPIVFETTDPVEARDKFLGIVKEFVVR